MTASLNETNADKLHCKVLKKNVPVFGVVVLFHLRELHWKCLDSLCLFTSLIHIQ